MRCLALVTDAFGGAGGIAQYNRDFLTALAASEQFERIVVLPRMGERIDDAVAGGIVQVAAFPGRIGYSAAALRLARSEKPNVIFCGHIRMSPLCALLARLSGARLWLQVHGIDAWEKPKLLVRWGAEQSDLITAVSRFTRDQMLKNWVRVEPWRIRVLPNTVRETFTPAAAPAELRTRYGLGPRRVLLTVSRISPDEIYKGHDRVIAALPELMARVPDLVYLVGGDGGDVGRLKQLAGDLGLARHVIFAGRIAGSELIDHFRLAQAFIMPSTKEGFGIVFIEAARCGIPVIGGRKDGSFDALREGRLGQAIDPDSRSELVEAVVYAFTRPHRFDPSIVGVFSRQNFEQHVAALARDLGSRAPRARDATSDRRFDVISWSRA